MIDTLITINSIQCLKDTISILESYKFELEQKLIQDLQHNINASKTYNIDDYKITINTAMNYKFDEKQYMEYLKAPEKIDPKFCIVKEQIVTDYELNKKAFRDCMEYGSPQDKLLAALFVTEKEKKPYVSIERKDVE